MLSRPAEKKTEALQYQTAVAPSLIALTGLARGVDGLFDTLDMHCVYRRGSLAAWGAFGVCHAVM